MVETIELKIARSGAQGDGIAETPEGPVYVPFTLAGEVVRAEVQGDRGRLLEVLKPSPERVAPLCPHFTACGGCVVQHMAPLRYLEWKSEQVRAAFAQRGIVIESEPVIFIGPGQRRRAALSAVRTGRGVVLGFHAAGTHDIVDLEMCPVVVPAISQAIAGLRGLLEPLLSRRGELRVTVTAVDNGLDVSVEECARELDADVRSAIARAAAAMRLVRIVIGGDSIYESAAPELRFGAGSPGAAGSSRQAVVVPPPGVFLQASREAERRMTELMLAALPKKVKRVADLFCGLGTFTFPLAGRAEVLAVDGDKDAIAALKAAVRNASGLKPIEARHRDLFREPLSRKELEGFDAVVIDPPRAGARAQAEMLAKSKVGTIIAVSCAPATLARDVRVLLDAGYQVAGVTPIDQFAFSAHIEAVAVLRR